MKAHSASAAGESQWQMVVWEWRRSWRPGLAALVGGSLGYSIYNAISSLFIEPFEESFGWTRGEIALAQSAGHSA